MTTLFSFPPAVDTAPDADQTGGKAGAGAADSPAAAAAVDGDLDQPPPGVQWKGKKKKQSKSKRSGDNDLYALLGLANERWTATEKQLKDAYRK